MDSLDLICLNSAAAPEPRGGNFYLLDKLEFTELFLSELEDRCLLFYRSLHNHNAPKTLEQAHRLIHSIVLDSC